MSEPITVCFPFIGDTVGGSHLSATLLMRNLSREVFQPVAVLHEDGPLSTYFDSIQIPYSILPLRGAVHGGPGVSELAIRLATSVNRIRAFLKDRKVDMVHTNDLRTGQTWSAASRLSGRPLVWHQRTKYARSRLTRAALTCASTVICISNFCRSTLPETVARRAVVVTNPFDVSIADVDRDQARQQMLRRIGAGNDARIVGFCGTLSVQKRPEVFLEAAARIHEHASQPVHFVLVGLDRDGRRAELEQQAAALGVEGRVHFVGFQPDILPWIAGFDLLLATQFDDAFGRTLVEAMLVGTIVVASETGGHLEIVRNNETGLLVRKDDPEAFAAACNRGLFDSGFGEALRNAAATYARSSFGIRDHVTSIEQIYRTVLA